ncbi:uncharacterized protein LAESUDRAFT_624937, partial [Laetiporus sulphureus 93-53]
PAPLTDMFSHLASTFAAHLISSSSIKASTPIPALNTFMISPAKKHHQELLDSSPQTKHEKELQDALHEATVHEACYKSLLRGQQAAMILQFGYCMRVKCQLATREEKEQLEKQKGKGKIVSDGLPRMLTDDAFVEIVAEHERKQEATEHSKEQRKTLREQ